MLPLQELNCYPKTVLRNPPMLREMQRLETINGHPAHDYLDTLISAIETTER